MPSSIGIYGERETKEGRFCSQETNNPGKEISKEIISLHCGNPSKEIRGRIEGSRPSAIRFCCCLVAKSWLLCDPMDCSLRGSCGHGTSQARILAWGCHFLLQGIFSTQE